MVTDAERRRRDAERKYIDRLRARVAARGDLSDTARKILDRRLWMLREGWSREAGYTCESIKSEAKALGVSPRMICYARREIAEMATDVVSVTKGGGAGLASESRLSRAVARERRERESLPVRITDRICGDWTKHKPQLPPGLKLKDQPLDRLRRFWDAIRAERERPGAPHWKEPLTLETVTRLWTLAVLGNLA